MSKIINFEQVRRQRESKLKSMDDEVKQERRKSRKDLGIYVDEDTTDASKKDGKYKGKDNKKL